ncbi:MAG: hypothetical protein CMH32_02300 [Micavibrio sp.]|nr:hypothetical protein [Micavibrio sp.]|tara:strand:+ start:298 stop:999 length:702 start_codon:yes stop_codon:yes gene_type:complete
MREDIVAIGNVPQRYGILASVDDPKAPAVVLINSGVVHHAGANRMSVLFARALQETGIASLRFDLCGIGDSPDRTDGIGWEPAAPIEIGEAITAYRLCRPDGALVLYGNCGGSAKGFWTALVDDRVDGLFLTNPPPHPTYNGEDDHVPPHLQDLIALLERGVKVAFVYAENDIGEVYFSKFLLPHLDEYLKDDRFTVSSVQKCNHTFASVKSRDAVIETGLGWVKRMFATKQE